MVNKLTKADFKAHIILFAKFLHKKDMLQSSDHAMIRIP